MFASNGKKEKIWLGILLVAFCSALSVIWFADYQELILSDVYARVAAEHGAEVVTWYKGLINTVPAAATAALTVLGQFAVYIIIAALSALVCLPVFRVIFKIEAKFRALFTINLFMAAITAFGAACELCAGVTLNTTNSIFSLGVIIRDPEGAFLTAAAAISIFTIVQMTAQFFALRELANRQDAPPAPNKAFAAALTCVLVLFALSFIISLVSAIFANTTDTADTIWRTYQQMHSMN